MLQLCDSCARVAEPVSALPDGGPQAGGHVTSQVRSAGTRRQKLPIRIGSLLVASCVGLAAAQSNSLPNSGPQGEGISLDDVVQSAERDYPQIHLSQEELNATIADIRRARTAYLPRIDALLQANRATRNNVFGTLLPQSTIPPMSGPVIGSNNGGSVWGSAAGVLVSWQPFDFGLRHADVQASRAAKDKADAALSDSQLEAGAAAADAFLSHVAAQETVRAASAAVENWNTLLKTIHALAAAQLRPGADESRIEAELAMARNQLVYARQADDESKATLVKFLSSAPANLNLDSKPLLTQLPPPEEEPEFNTAAHPLMEEQRAAVAESAAHLHALQRTWVPQFTLEGAASSRGTGAETDGRRLPGWNGLTPNIQNYAAGFNVNFSFLDFARIHAEASAQSATMRAEQARQQLIDKELNERFAKATAALTAAREVANNTPIELKSARMAFDQAKARYQAGLTPIDDLAQAQRLLVQAEVDNSIARLSVWRALLQLNAARGDLRPFLQAVPR
ncbi:TolC family protein [Acidobacteria bacterium AB60]|nr:TolC family protein [Acidobacteria bacterium AB60]